MIFSPSLDQSLIAVMPNRARRAVCAKLQLVTLLGREIAVRGEPGHPDITAELQGTLLDVIPALTSDSLPRWRLRDSSRR